MADGTHRERPLSPHLQIWRFTVTMFGSILHRITGVACYGGVVLLTAWFVALALGGDIYGLVARLVFSPFGLFVMFGFSWALIYHTLTGLRHLYWDAGRGLDFKVIQTTSRLIIVGSLGLAVMVFVLALSDGGVN